MVGRVLIDGELPGSARVGRMLSLVPQSLALYSNLSTTQNVTHFVRMQELSRAAAVACARILEEVGLTSRAGEPAYRIQPG
jgi:ABC-type multidrug transport system ATPase subunit